MSLVVTGLKHPQGLALTPDGQLLVAAERFQGEGEAQGGTVFQVNLEDGQMTPLVGEGFLQPHSVILDQLGALFFSAKQPGQGPQPEQGVLIKRAPGGTLTTFAVPLDDPTGLIFDSHGNLYATEQGTGRLLRFQAPPPPQVDPLPAFTNQNPLTVTGTAEPNALLVINGGASSTTVTADPAGRFTAQVELTPNAANALQAFTTGAGGQGLVSPPTEATVVHDAIPPLVGIVSPTEGATVTGAFPVEVEVTDTLAGVARVDLFVDGSLVGMTNVAPYRFELEAGAFTGGLHTLMARATDRAGNQATASITILVVTLRITITTPADGALLPTPIALVQGVIEASAPEVGVVVNGVLAQVSGRQFAALVPLGPGSNLITATATDPFRNTATATITVTVPEGVEPQLLLTASPPSGVAPLTVAFSALSFLPTPIAQVELDADGDGTVDFRGASLEGPAFTYSQPGLYLPTVTVTDAQGNRLTASTIVQVYDRTTLDTVLQSKWTALKDALRVGDIARAVTLIHTDTRAAYEAQLTRFSPTTLANIDRYMTTIQLIEVGPGGAQYEMLRERNGQMLSFAVWFAVDGDGLWRLRRF